MTQPTNPVRTRMKAPERRESILDAAELTFAGLGYRGAGMADIATAAGVTQPMLYRHFASKEELFLEVLDRSIGQVLAQWEETPDLLAMGHAYAQLAASHPHVVRLRQMAMAESDPVIKEHMRTLFRKELVMIRQRADAAEAAGQLAPGATPESVVWLFTALGMLVDASVALDLEEAQTGVSAAGLLFLQAMTGHTVAGKR